VESNCIDIHHFHGGMKQKIESANHGSLTCESPHRLQKFPALPYFKEDGSISRANGAAHVSFEMVTNRNNKIITIKNEQRKKYIMQSYIIRSKNSLYQCH